MRVILCIFAGLTFLSLPSVTLADSPFLPDGTAQNVKTCFRAPFNSYENWVTMIEGSVKNKATRRYQSDEERKKFIEQRLKTFRRMFLETFFDAFKANTNCYTYTYKVGEATVSGYVIEPKNAQNLPVLIYNRGGNGGYGSVVMASMLNNLYPIASEGFIIVGSQYRGTFEKQPKFDDEFGGNDVNDVIALEGVIKGLVNADQSKVGMYGSSRGAMQTLMALKDMKNIKAIGLSAGVYDLEKEINFRPEMENVYAQRIPNYSQEKKSQLAKRSALKWINELPKIPMLILHGSADEKVSVQNARDLEARLSEEGYPYKLVIYGGDNHGLSMNADESDRELVAWFKRHLHHSSGSR